MATDPVTPDDAELPVFDLVGQTLRETYRIVEVLDRGGMGIVFGADHVRLRRRVAVKVLAQHLAADGAALARFQREADIISRLVHPHIVQILDFDTTDGGAPYIVMELLHGESLADRLLREQRLPTAEAVRIAGQVASALATAHGAGIVHRDLKPANIFLVNVAGQPSFVKLLDFGISKYASGTAALTGEFDILGTPDYMAPEQAMGKTARVDHRADQFSLAAITYEMLTSVAPFEGDTVMSTLNKVINDPPVPISERVPSLPVALDAVIARALSKTPADRYEDVAEFVNAFSEAAGHALSIVPGLTAHGAGTVPFTSGGGVRVRDSAVAETLVAVDDRRITPAPASVTKPREAGRYTGIDVTTELTAAIDQARMALGFDDLDLALSYAESALALADRAPSAASVAALESAGTLFDLIYARRLGPLNRRIEVRQIPSSSTPDVMSPAQVFLISRLDRITLDEALDISPLPRSDTLRLLVRLIQQGVIEVR